VNERPGNQEADHHKNDEENQSNGIKGLTKFGEEFGYPRNPNETHKPADTSGEKGKPPNALG
jgi:hypothetical protein